MADLDAVRGIILDVQREWRDEGYYYADESEAVCGVCNEILDRINNIDESRQKEFVIFAKLTSDVYHRSAKPQVTLRDGNLLMCKSKCGRWFAFGSNRSVASSNDRRPCSRCFSSGA